MQKQKSNDNDAESATSQILSDDKVAVFNNKKDEDTWNDSEEVEEDEILVEERDEPPNVTFNFGSLNV